MHSVAKAAVRSIVSVARLAVPSLWPPAPEPLRASPVVQMATGHWKRYSKDKIWFSRDCVISTVVVLMVPGNPSLLRLS